MKNIYAEGDFLDITQGQSPEGLKGINTTQQQPEVIDQYSNLQNSEDYKEFLRRSDRRANMTVGQRVAESTPGMMEYVGTPELGQSRFDKRVTSMEQIDDINNFRGQAQSGAVQLLSGLTKGGVLAGTTFVETVGGLIVGIPTAIAEGRWSGLWDNPLSNAMNSINEWSEKAIPNYYTTQELNNEWYENFFSANFLGDKVLKNLGFVVGAGTGAMTGMGMLSRIPAIAKARNAYKAVAKLASKNDTTVGAILNAARTGDTTTDALQFVETVTKNAKLAGRYNSGSKWAGSLIAGSGEARIEAVSNSKLFFDNNKQNIDNYWAKVQEAEAVQLMNEDPTSFYYIEQDGRRSPVLTPEAQAEVARRANAKFDYDKAIEKISEDRLRMGNLDYIMNIALLTTSDFYQFGRYFAGGWKNARKTAQSVATETVKDGKPVYKALSGVTAKSVGKMLGRGVAEGPYEEMMQGVAAQIGDERYSSKLNDFFGAKINPDAEEQTVSWIKVVGNSLADNYGTVEGWEQAAIGGLIGFGGAPMIRTASQARSEGKRAGVIWAGGIFEDRREMKETSARNKEIADQLNEWWRDEKYLNYYQGDTRHKVYDWQMADAAANNDKFAYENAAHSQLISDAIMFDKAGRLDDLYEILDMKGEIEEMSLEDLKNMFTNPSSENSPYKGMTAEQIKPYIYKQIDEVKKQVDDYVQISSDLKTQFGDIFSGDELEEMVWMMSSIKNWEERFQSLHRSIQDRVKDINIEAQTQPNVHETTKKVFKKLQTNTPAEFLDYMDNPAVKEMVDKADNIVAKKPDKDVIANDIKDLKKLYDIREKYISKYQEYATRPGLLKDKQAKQIEAALENAELQDNLETIGKLNDAATVQDVQKVVEDSTVPQEQKEKILEDLKDNPIVQEYRHIDKYAENLNRTIDSFELDPQVAEDARNLFEHLRQNSENLESLVNPERVYSVTDPSVIGLTDMSSAVDPELQEQGIPVDTGSIDRERLAKAQLALADAIYDTNRQEEYRDKFKSPDKPVPTEVLTKDKAEEEEVKDVRVEEPFEEPVGDDENLIDSRYVLEEGEALPSNENSTKFYYSPSIPQFGVQESKRGDFRTFAEVELAKAKGSRDYSYVYDYLVRKGAFDYLNEGKLKVDDALDLVIDPEYNNPYDRGTPAVFFAKQLEDGTHQIVGITYSEAGKVALMPGLAKLLEQVREEYSKRKVEEGKENELFVSTVSIKVAKIMLGKIRWGKKDIGGTLDSGERSLAKLYEDDPSVKPLFGVAREGRLETNGVIKKEDIVYPKKIDEKNGRLYVLIPAPGDVYKVAPARVKRFNADNFNPDKESTKDNPKYKSIIKSLTNLAKAKDPESVSKAAIELRKDLYLGDVRIDLMQNEYGTSIAFTPVTFENGRRVYHNERAVFVPNDPNTPIEEIVDNLRTILFSGNHPIQVDVNKINKGKYNQSLLDSDLLITDIWDFKLLDNWFVTNFYSHEERREIDAIPPKAKNASKPVTGSSIENVFGSTDNAEGKTQVSLDDQNYYIDKKTKVITNVVNNTLVDSTSTLGKTIRVEAFLAKEYGETMEGVNMVNGVILLPSGDVYDRKTRTFITGAEKDSFINKLKNPKKQTLIEPPTIAELEGIKAMLYSNSKDKTNWNRYLNALSNRYKIDIVAYLDNPTPEHRKLIVDALSELTKGITEDTSSKVIVDKVESVNNAQEALVSGTRRKRLKSTVKSETTNVSKVLQKSSETNTKEEGNLDFTKNILTFAGLKAETKEALIKKGFTESIFEKMSQEEREHAIKCAEV